MKDTYEADQIKAQLNKLDDLAYMQSESQEIIEDMVSALEAIIEVPNNTASDSRALREIIKIAKSALDKVVEVEL